jgi:hypothetical protein
MVLEELRRRSRRSGQNEIPLGAAAMMLGCEEDDVVEKILKLMEDVRDSWDWVMSSGGGCLAVDHRFARRDAARVRRLMKQREYKWVCQLPPDRMFNLTDASKVLKSSRRRAREWLHRCVSMGYLQPIVLIPLGGTRPDNRWQRKF